MTTLNDAQTIVNEPPYTNRGVGGSHKSLAPSVFSLDWLRVTIWASYAGIKPFLQIMGADVGMESTGHGGIGFRALYQGLHGFQVYAEPVNEGAVYVSVSIPGEALHNIGLQKVIQALVWLYEEDFRYKVSRADLAFDTQLFNVQQFEDAYFEGLAVTPSKKWDVHKSSENNGHTFYVGSRQSLAFLRVYHKVDGDSYGSEPFTRVEMELKGIRADMAISELLAADVSSWSEMACGWLNSFIEIPLPWWAAFLSSAKKSWVKIKRRISTVASMGVWLKNQVAPTLATWVQAVSQGESDKLTRQLNDLLLDGQSRFTKRNRALIDFNLGDGDSHFAVYGF